MFLCEGGSVFVLVLVDFTLIYVFSERGKILYYCLYSDIVPSHLYIPFSLVEVENFSKKTTDIVQKHKSRLILNLILRLNRKFFPVFFLTNQESYTFSAYS